MASITLKYTKPASNAFTDSILKKPIEDLNRLFAGVSVTRYNESTEKTSNEIWKLDQSQDSIICEKIGALKLTMCSQSVKRLDISTILKISETAEDSQNTVKIFYIDAERSKTTACSVSFADEDTCRVFLKAMGYMINKSRLDDAHHRQFKYILRVFDQHDADSNGFLDPQELEKVWADLKIVKSERLFNYLCNKFNSESSSGKASGKPGLSVNEFVRLYNTMSRIVDVELIFCTYAYTNGSINVQQLCRFLKNEQREIVSADAAEAIISKLEPNSEAQRGCEFTLDGFVAYLFSPQHNELASRSARPFQQTNQPFDHYYVKSCFVVPDCQGSSTPKKLLEDYSHALNAGYRHFELDLFASASALIVHVGSQRQSCPLIEIGRLLYVFEAFVTPKSYPLLLTLNICFESAAHLQSLSKTLVGIFKNKLAVIAESDEIPLLEQLFGKILIRSNLNKILRDEKRKTEPKMQNDSENDGSAKQSIPQNAEAEQDYVKLSELVAFDVHDSGKLDKTSEIEDNAEKINNKKITRFKTINFDSMTFANFSQMTEAKALQITNSYFVSIAPQNAFDMSHPTLFWNHGVQAVVTPFPKRSLHRELSSAFFSLNADCGYVLKSQSMIKYDTPSQANLAGAPAPNNRTMSRSGLNPNDNFSTISGATTAPNDCVVLTLSVVCGRMLSDIATRPFVYVELYGPAPMFGSTDVAEGSRDALKINPRFNNQFHIVLPKAAYRNSIVQISLWDNAAIERDLPNQMLGRASVHVSNMRQGFRVVSLFDEAGAPIAPTSLLVHVRKSLGSSHSAPSHFTASSASFVNRRMPSIDDEQ